MPDPQFSLFSSDGAPPGFALRHDFVDGPEEGTLVAAIQRLEFSAVKMRGGVARRRTVHYGWTYAYDARSSTPGPEIPEYLLAVRARAAAWAALDAETLSEALVTEYPPGAGIGWHRDAPMFGDVIAGVSLLSSCRMKFRPYVSPNDLAQIRASGPRRATYEAELPPRSAYLITGAARRDFEHGIPETAGLRYSITFRTMRARQERSGASRKRVAR